MLVVDHLCKTQKTTSRKQRHFITIRIHSPNSANKCLSRCRRLALRQSHRSWPFRQININGMARITHTEHTCRKSITKLSENARTWVKCTCGDDRNTQTRSKLFARPRAVKAVAAMVRRVRRGDGVDVGKVASTCQMCNGRTSDVSNVCELGKYLTVAVCRSYAYLSYVPQVLDFGLAWWLIGNSGLRKAQAGSLGTRNYSPTYLLSYINTDILDSECREINHTTF